MDRKRYHLLESLQFPAVMVVLMVFVHFVKTFFWHGMYRLGIFPREVDGVWGIFFAPFIHGDIGHLLSNAAPMFLTLWMMLYFYPRVALRGFLLIYFLTGLSVWLFGRSVYHIGASGVIYGLVAFIFWSGIFRRNLKSIVLSLIMVFLYSGMIFGILPNERGISWESHLFGGVVGILVAWWYKEEIEADEQRSDAEWLHESDGETYFLPRDIFEKTREERRRLGE